MMSSGFDFGWSDRRARERKVGCDASRACACVCDCDWERAGECDGFSARELDEEGGMRMGSCAKDDAWAAKGSAKGLVMFSYSLLNDNPRAKEPDRPSVAFTLTFDADGALV